MSRLKFSGKDMERIRTMYGLSHEDFAKVMGYSGKPSSLGTQIKRLESGGRAINPQIGTLLYMFEKFGIPKALRG